MSEKRYAIVQVDEWRKKYEDTTETHFRSSGFTSNDGIDGRIVLSTLDSKTPDKHQFFLVTLEPIPTPSPTGDSSADHIGTWGPKFLDERREADREKASIVKNGRKFR